MIPGTDTTPIAFDGAEDDPIARQRDLLLTAGADATALDALRESAQAEMVGALRAAAETPFPDPETAFQDVQDIGSPQEEAY